MNLEEYLPMVAGIARGIHDKLPQFVDLDEMIAAGRLGLVDAAAKYDPTMNVPFRAYAKHRIRGAILDALRTNDWMTRDARVRHKTLGEDAPANVGPVAIEPYAELIVDQRPGAQEALELASARELVAKAMATLPERYRRVLILYYTHELTQLEISRELGVNESRVGQIRHRALGMLRAELGRQGVSRLGEIF